MQMCLPSLITHSSLRGHSSTPLLKATLFAPTCPLFKVFVSPSFFSVPPPFNTFYTVSPPDPQTINPPFSFILPYTMTSKISISSNNHNHLNTDETNQNLHHLLFYHYSITLLWLKMILLHRIVEEETNRSMTMFNLHIKSLCKHYFLL